MADDGHVHISLEVVLGAVESNEDESWLMNVLTYGYRLLYAIPSWSMPESSLAVFRCLSWFGVSQQLPDYIFWVRTLSAFRGVVFSIRFRFESW